MCGRSDYIDSFVFRLLLHGSPRNERARRGLRFIVFAILVVSPYMRRSRVQTFNRFHSVLSNRLTQIFRPHTTHHA